MALTLPVSGLFCLVFSGRARYSMTAPNINIGLTIFLEGAFPPHNDIALTLLVSVPVLFFDMSLPSYFASLAELGPFFVCGGYCYYCCGWQIITGASWRTYRCHV